MEILFKKHKIILKSFYLAFLDLMNNDGMENAGYLAFMILFSLFPFLAFFTAVISGFSDLLNQYSIVKDFITIVMNNMPNNLIADLLPRVGEIISEPPKSILKVAFLGMIWTSSSMVEAIRTILNKVLRVSKYSPYIMRRLLSVVQFLTITFIVITTIFALTMVPLVFKTFDKELLFDRWLLYFRYIMIELVLFISITWLYYSLPSIKQRLISVFPGAITVIFLWTVASVLFTKYINILHQFNIIYGSLGGIIISLLFFYIVSLFFIYGAMLNYRLKRV